VRELSRALV